MSFQPPFYRNLNPNGPVLEAFAQDELYPVSLTGPSVADGALAFGDIAENTVDTVLAGWDASLVTIPAGDIVLRTYLAVYTGDDGAFTLDGSGLTDGRVLPLSFVQNTLNLGGGVGGFAYTLVALAADEGVERTGTLTVYALARLGDGGLPTTSKIIATLDLSKTYVAL